MPKFNNKNSELKICYFPGREQSYSRNRVLLKGMKEVGIKVFDCSCSKKFFIRYFISFFKFLLYKHKCDFIFVGFLGHFLVPLVKIFTRKKIVFDVFVSVYLTMVVDRKKFSPNGILAKFAKFVDKLSCHLADIIITDTEQHTNYFVNEYGLHRDKFLTILVGSDDSIMYPRNNKTEADTFVVHFHGEFQSLHGAEHIVEAAAMLPDISFRMIGNGNKLPICKQKANDMNLKNVQFIPPVSYEELPQYMSNSSICLGIFGNTKKSHLVIPHKIYEALAMSKPIITANTSAVKELLTDEENVLFCNPADPASLSEAISRLKDDQFLCNKIAKNGYKIFKQKCTPYTLAKQLELALRRFS